MSLTYTSASDRVLLQVRASRWRLEMRDAMLVAASILSLLAIVLARSGTLRALDASERAGGRVAAVNLNTVANSEALEPALSLVFSNPPERRSAARGLFRFLVEHRENGRQLPNVGALARARVEMGTAAPATGRLLTPSQLAVLKPSFTVRTREAFTNDVVLFGREWGFRLADVDVPVRWWHGDADSLVPLDHARQAASLLPDCELVVRPEESHLGGFGITHEVFSWLAAVGESAG